MREVAITAWGSVAQACVVQGLSCEVQCWPPVEDLVGSRPLSGKETARIADALATLLMPAVESQAACEKCMNVYFYAFKIIWVAKAKMDY